MSIISANNILESVDECSVSLLYVVTISAVILVIVVITSLIWDDHVSWRSMCAPLSTISSHDLTL